jgi:quercetin dioxygenase-like cupin family protein
MGARILGTAPPARGTRFAVIDFPPGNHPHMHRTETVDYVIVIEGEIEMDMDDSTVKLKQGDIMIQRGTNHAWANRSDRRARVAFVLVDAEPLGIGNPVVGSASAGETWSAPGTGEKGDPSCGVQRRTRCLPRSPQCSPRAFRPQARATTRPRASG